MAFNFFKIFQPKIFGITLSFFLFLFAEALFASDTLFLFYINGDENLTTFMGINQSRVAYDNIRKNLVASNSDGLILYDTYQNTSESPKKSGAGATYYDLIQKGKKIVHTEISETDLTDQKVLSGFLNKAEKLFPFHKKIFIYWGHKIPCTKEACFDMSHKEASYSMKDFIYSIIKVTEGRKGYFELMIFDCCAMATLNNVVLLSKITKYFIASELNLDARGFSYEFLLSAKNYLNKADDTNIVKLGKLIIDTSKKRLFSEGSLLDLSLSLIKVPYDERKKINRLKSFILQQGFIDETFEIEPKMFDIGYLAGKKPDFINELLVYHAEYSDLSGENTIYSGLAVEH